MALGLMIAALAGPALADQMQFDLVCTGKQSDGHDWLRRVSVDLQRKAWCQRPGGDWTGCASVGAIQEVAPGRIVFYDEYGLNGHSAFVVDRGDGTASEDQTVVQAKGACKRAPFTPMPANRF